MSKTVIKAPRSLNGDGLAFVREYLRQYDLRELSRIRILHESYTVHKWYPGVWGNCKPPDPFWGKTHNTRFTYRMEIKIRGEEKDLPFPPGFLKRLPRRYGGGRAWVELFDNLDDLLVWVTGHEMYHFLCWTRQLDGDVANEIQANALGRAWVAEFQDWRRKNGCI